MGNFLNTVSDNTSQSGPNVPVPIGVDNSQEEVETATTNISSASSNTHNPSSPMRRRNDENEPSDGDYKCPVCLESVREPLLAKYGHIFCRQCIETAIRSSHKCPMCNMKRDISDAMRIYL
ncbi:E3 ubiquitin-protein ligase RNF125-like [Drosophila miranda]|uniref:E3 ubiquitin-protein ligase RNF125-like n=1 Tax=Drosophila miranda TaxID=7229 RepID=UPI0007E6D607|nr:E3 ubiquitin-protein ligase RNF125-like [Drosophila miranda]